MGVNEPQDHTPKVYKKGEQLLHTDVNWLTAQVLKRLVGANGLLVRTAGGTATLQRLEAFRRNKPADRVLVEIATEVGGGTYTFTKVQGVGPASGTMKEVEDVTGLAVGTKVWAFKAPVEWWFFAPAPSGAFHGAQAKRTGTSFTIPDATPGPVTFDTSEFRDTAYFTFSGGIYTALVTGWHRIKLNAKVQINNSRNIDAIFYKNSDTAQPFVSDGLGGAMRIATGFTAASGTSTTLVLNGLQEGYLVAGDTVRPYMYAHGPGSTTVRDLNPGSRWGVEWLTDEY